MINLTNTRGLLVSLLLFHTIDIIADEPNITINLQQYDPACGIEIIQAGTFIDVNWPIDHKGRHARIRFDTDTKQPLIQSISFGSWDSRLQVLANGLDPVLFVRVGNRDLEKRDGWTIFFDRMQRKQNEVFPAVIDCTNASGESHARRAVLTIGNVKAGPFEGKLRWTFFANSPLILQEAVLTTNRPRTAYLYDAGIICRQSLPTRMFWKDPSGTSISQEPANFPTSRNLAVRGRTIGAEFNFGALAIFPPPHRYFYPLDFSNNFRNIWVGRNYQQQSLPFGFGIRHDPNGDDRYVPWFNAPPNTRQNMGVFLLINPGTAEDVLKDVGRLTRDDQFEPIDGHTVFSSHYHVEHTREMLQAQEQQKQSDDTVGTLPSGDSYRIPAELKSPDFVETLRKHGVDIVHLAEFHYGNTPSRSLDKRVEQLQLLHAECDRLSDRRFLLLPGEEPNVHLGGHWISFFPKPIYWVLNRNDDAPFVIEHPSLGRIYQVGGKADVLQLLRREGGLAWTAHPRIKGSTGYPDRYRNELFYQSDRFLGGAWKAMPADLSEPRLGSRVLDLLDDMSNWGTPKYVVGEVDVFKIEHDHELYAHMNVNYLRLNRVPRFKDGWQSILDALRGGRFFVSTGEVLIPEFMINRKRSGEAATANSKGQFTVQFDLKWTFPLQYAEIIFGDGEKVERQRFDLSMTPAYGTDSFEFDVRLKNPRWVRLAIWDVATNGAFTQPVWIRDK